MEAGEEAVGAVPTGPRAALRLIGSRNFGPYFVGNAASAAGTWFQTLAAALLVYRLTHSAFLLGVLGFCTFVPILVLAPWSGSVADRLDRRRLLLATQLSAATLSATLAALAWAGLARVWVVILVSVGMGLISAFSAPASQAFVGELVERRDLASAVGLNSMTYNLARATGPALAAVSVRTLGIPASFAVNAGSYFLLVVALLVVRPAPRPFPDAAKARLRDSLALLRARPQLVRLLLIAAAVGFGSDPVNTEAPAFAHAYGRPDTDAGYVIGAFGAGAVSAAFLLTGRVAGSRRRMIWTLGCLVSGIVGLSLSPWLPLGFAFLFAAGFGYLASNTSAASQLQLGVGPEQWGRVMALWSVAFLGLRPLASITDGAIAGAWGVRAAGVCLAAPALAAALLLLALERRRTSYTSLNDR